MPFTEPQVKKTRAKKTTAAPEAAAPKPGCKVRVIPALNGKKDSSYEETAAAALNETIAEGYELLSVVPSADAKNLVAFFKLSI